MNRTPTGASTEPRSGRTTWRRAIRTELRISLDTPTARLFLAASVVMAIVSGSANIAALDDPTTESARQLALHAATVPCGPPTSAR